MCNEAVVFAYGKKRLWWFKFVVLEPCDQSNKFYLEKNIENCSNAAPLDSTSLIITKTEQIISYF